jgi:hypothetical protein
MSRSNSGDAGHINEASLKMTGYEYAVIGWMMKNQRSPRRLTEKPPKTGYYSNK